MFRSPAAFTEALCLPLTRCSSGQIPHHLEHKRHTTRSDQYSWNCASLRWTQKTKWAHNKRHVRLPTPSAHPLRRLIFCAAAATISNQRPTMSRLEGKRAANWSSGRDDSTATDDSIVPVRNSRPSPCCSSVPFRRERRLWGISLCFHFPLFFSSAGRACVMAKDETTSYISGLVSPRRKHYCATQIAGRT